MASSYFGIKPSAGSVLTSRSYRVLWSEKVTRRSRTPVQPADCGTCDCREASQTLSDVEVVRRVREGETALFEVLMRRYNQRLYRVARAIVKDDAETEDVMQQAYVNAYMHLGQFAEKASFSTWLTKIAVHEALARSRRRGASERHIVSASGDDTVSDIPTRAPDPEHQAFATELRSLLESAVDRLPEDHRIVFTLREIEGLSTAETAESLGISEDNVKARLHRARAQLRDDLLARTGATTSGAFQFHLSRCDRVVAGVLEKIAAARAGHGLGT
jgi:RNA polymerase sigma-70 factor (ECF subfamily)